MRLRVVAITLFPLVLASCAVSSANTESWIEFLYSPGWVAAGSIDGVIFRNGKARISYISDSGRGYDIVDSLSDLEVQHIASLVAEMRAVYGERLVVRGGLFDEGHMHVGVTEDSREVFAVSLAGPFVPCSLHDRNEVDAYTLWNAILKAFNSPKIRTRDSMFQCDEVPE